MDGSEMHCKRLELIAEAVVGSGSIRSNLFKLLRKFFFLPEPLKELEILITNH